MSIDDVAIDKSESDPEFGGSARDTAVSADLSSSSRGTFKVPPKLVEQLLGKTIGQHWELVAPIGSGGMGIVYKAKHTLLGSAAAIKVLAPQHVLDEVSVRRFEQEAKAACSLGHPNIIVTRDYGMDDQGRAFLVMDYLEGAGLDAIIDNAGGPLDPYLTVEIISQICEGMAYAHKNGVIHRDIKPGNIIVSTASDGRQTATVVDFGLAKIVSGEEGQNLTQTGDVCGSPLYMSPEQCMGRKIDARSDIYSLGCVMYEALTGKPPLVGEGSLSTLMLHVNGIPKPLPSGKVGDLMDRLNFIVLRCLEKEPHNRYQSMTEIHDDLELAREAPKSKWQSTAVALNRKVSNTKKEGARRGQLVLLVVLMLTMGTSLYLWQQRTSNNVSSNVIGSATASDLPEQLDRGRQLFDTGRSEALKGHYDQAIQDYDQAIKLNHKLRWLYQDRAEAYLHLEPRDEVKALGDIDRQMENFPDEVEPLEKAAVTLKELQQNKLAEQFEKIAYCSRRIKLEQNSAALYLSRAKFFEDMGKDRLAELDRNKSLALSANASH